MATIGNSRRAQDGFALYLTTLPQRPDIFQKTPEPAEDFLAYLPKQQRGSFMIFFSQSEDKVFYNYMSNNETLVTRECAVPISKKNYSFFIKASDSFISLNYHDNTSNNYSKCAMIHMMKDNFNKFYVSMLTRTSDLVRYDVTAMSFGVDFENPVVSEFETIYDETLPKLFKKINYYINTDYMVSPKKTEYSEGDNLDITMLIAKQQSVFKNLDDANYYLSQNLEESTDLIDRLSLHKETADNSLVSIVRFMENWMKKSNQELTSMENDLLNAETSLKSFNMEEMVGKAKKKIDRLKKKITQNEGNFSKYEQLSTQVKGNKDTIKRTLADMKGFKKKLKKYLKKRQNRRGKKGNGGYIWVVYLLLLFWGLCYIVVCEFFVIFMGCDFYGLWSFCDIYGFS